jgi:putative ABC transport system permease protein
MRERPGIAGKDEKKEMNFHLDFIILSLLSGAIGLLIGVLVGWLSVGAVVLAVLGSSASGMFPLIITPESLILPFAVSAAIALIFGLYPAIRASRLDPIVALRRAR